MNNTLKKIDNFTLKYGKALSEEETGIVLTGVALLARPSFCKKTAKRTATCDG